MRINQAKVGDKKDNCTLLPDELDTHQKLLQKNYKYSESIMKNAFRVSSIALSIGLALGSVPALAAGEDDAAKKKKVEKIAVVGSRAAPRSVSDSAVPVDVVSGDEFVKQGVTDMSSLLQNVVPSFNVNDQPINDASTLVRPANLRGLSSDSTLILVNGKRRHRSAVITFLGGSLSDGAQGPDISVIPSNALKQVEVLRDGAAAQYGSDAIAGVINFILKDDSEGGSFEARYGSFYEGDGDTMVYAGNIGLPLTDAGFANISMEYKESDPTSRSVQRDDAAALVAAGNTNVAPVAQVWGSPEFKYDFKLFGNFGLDIGNDKEVYMFTNWAEREVEGGFYFRHPHTRGGVYGGPNVDITPNNGIDDPVATLLVGDLTPDDGVGCPVVPITDNVLTSDAYQQVAADPNCFAFNEMLPGGFTPKFGGTVVDASIVMGTKGELKNGMYYDISGSLGRNEVEFALINSINPSMGPDTPTSFSPGKYVQIEKNFNIDLSEPITVKGWDEPINVAGGFEYRNETFEIQAGDPASYEIGPLAFNPVDGTSQGFGIGSNGFPGFKPQDAGSFGRHSYGAYLDVEAYVTENWMLAGALRYEDYSDFGDTLKGKVTSRLQLNDEWAIRGAYSTGFRAPTVGQSNVRNVTTAFGENGLEDQATLPPTHPIAVLKGGTALQPEESRSISFGIVADLDSGLYVTADYFNIEVTDRISQTSPLALSDADKAALQASGVPDASSFSSVKYFTNDFDTTTQGLDVVANYAMPMMGGETTLAFAYNWTDTEVDSFNPDNIGAAKIRMLEDNLPEHRFTFTTNHTNGDWSILGRVSYYDEIYEDHLDAGGAFNIEAGAEFTFDAEVSYAIDENFTATVGAKNLFDETPDDNPWASSVAGSLYPTTSPIGINGGFYYFRLVYAF
jgi:iron complex outermembrane receptor protein